MRYLFKGSQTPERFALLLGLSKISSDALSAALFDYLVRGIDKNAAAALNGVANPNLTRALNQLNAKAAIVEQIKELDWQRM
jgi:hypothetical protein